MSEIRDEIVKQIEKATEEFKESLENLYLKDNTPFYGVGFCHLNGILTGKISFYRLKNGNLKISGEIPAVAFSEKCKGLPHKFEDWDIFPLIVKLFNKDL